MSHHGNDRAALLAKQYQVGHRRATFTAIIQFNYVTSYMRDEVKTNNVVVVVKIRHFSAVLVSSGFVILQEQRSP